MKICAITMVYRDYWALARWYRHYGGLLGFENLYIIAHGKDDKIERICPEANVVPVPRDSMAGFDRVRGRIMDGFQAGLSQAYDWVIRTDADELICLDPDRYDHFADLFEKHEETALFALGLNVFPRRGGYWAVFSGHYSKAWAAHESVPFLLHGVKVKHRDLKKFRHTIPQGVYLMHLKFADRSALADANRHRLQIASGLEEGLPGAAWKSADEHSAGQYDQVDSMDEVSWTQARDGAFKKLTKRPGGDRKRGLVRTRAFQFTQKCKLPGWFPNID